MVVIRLARVGRKKYPVYRIVAADKARSVTSKYLAVLGTYNPHTKQIELDKELIKQFLDNGAQASDRVLRLFKANGVDLPKWANIHDRNKAPKAKEGDEKEEPTKGSDDSSSNSSSEAKAKGEASATDEVATDASDTAEQKAVETKDAVGTAEAVDKQADDIKTEENTADAAVETAQAETKAKPEKEASKE
jgi:small subunit ribosomal protein S16